MIFIPAIGSVQYGQTIYGCPHLPYETIVYAGRSNAWNYPLAMFETQYGLIHVPIRNGNVVHCIDIANAVAAIIPYPYDYAYWGPYWGPYWHQPRYGRRILRSLHRTGLFPSERPRRRPGRRSGGGRPGRGGRR